MIQLYRIACFVLFIPALILFAISLLINVSALFSVNLLEGSMARTRDLSMGVFFVVLPSMLLYTLGHYLSITLSCLRDPDWFRMAFRVILVYAIINFISSFYLILHSHETAILYGIRGFSGHWMLFYFMAIRAVYPFKTLTDVPQENVFRRRYYSFNELFGRKEKKELLPSMPSKTLPAPELAEKAKLLTTEKSKPLLTAKPRKPEVQKKSLLSFLVEVPAQKQEKEQEQKLLPDDKKPTHETPPDRKPFLRHKAGDQQSNDALRNETQRMLPGRNPQNK